MTHVLSFLAGCACTAAVFAVLLLITKDTPPSENDNPAPLAKEDGDRP